MPYSRALAELDRGHEASFGGKSSGLGELLAAGIAVPPGFALSTEAYLTFRKEAGIGDPTAEAIRAAPVPEAVREEVAARYAELGRAAGEPDPPVAVRSSAVGEDSAEATFAGQQDSYLWVRGAGEVCDAVRNCWASLYNASSISYRARLRPAGDEPAMGVAVQLMVDAAVSGVLFTCNPVSGDPSMVAINASWGLGLAVVGGEVTPDDYLLSKVTGEVVREHVHDKHVEYVPHPEGRGALAVEVPEQRRAEPCLDRSRLAELVALAQKVHGYFGAHQDVEWAIARGGELFVVQSRPVTTLPQREKKERPSSAISMVMNTFGVRTDG